MNLYTSNQGIFYLRLLIVSGMCIGSGVLPFHASSQEVNVGNGACLVNSGTLFIVNNTSLANSGTITNTATGSISLSGNWLNDGNYNAVAGSTVALNGSAPQTLGGNSATTFSNLSLNNSNGFSLSNNIVVDGILSFQGGLLTPGNWLITIGPEGNTAGADSSGYVNGKLVVTFTSPSSKQFPIGKGGHYHPLGLQFTSISGTSLVTAEQFEVPLSGTLPSGYTLLSTDRSWKITQSGGSNLQYYLTLDPRGYAPTHSVMILKQDSGTISAYTTNSPYYTNIAPMSSFSEFGLGEGSGYDLTGSFRYPNSVHTPLDSIWVVLKQNNIPTDSVFTKASGSFLFSNKLNGIYTVGSHTDKAWLGVNATDALKVQRHYIGVEVMTEPVKLQAADVDNNLLINLIDGIKIKRRFVEMDAYFDLGDWTFAKPTGGDTVIVSNSHFNQNFSGLCVGDVTGSNIPGTAASGAGFLALDQSEIIRAAPGEEIEIPVKVDRACNLGAISFVAAFPIDLMQINEIKIQQGDPYFTSGNKGLRMAWSEIGGLSLDKDQVMMRMVVRISNNFSKNDQITLTLGAESEVTNSEGNAFDTLILKTPAILYKYGEGVESNSNLARFEVYPVPSNGDFTAEISSTVPTSFSILLYNQLGQLVSETKEIMVHGKLIHRFHKTSLPGGIYTIVLRNKEVFIPRKILINH